MSDNPNCQQKESKRLRVEKEEVPMNSDLISSLPDEVLSRILSFLSTEDAAKTSFLSKRWRFLLASVSNLDFESTIYDYRKAFTGTRERQGLHLPNSFKLFVDRVMALQGNSRLNKFSLRCKFGSNQSPVDRWIENVVERGVLELDLHITSQFKYLLPPKVLMGKNLVKLKLRGTAQFNINVREVFLPELKTLHIRDVAFDDGDDETGTAFAKLISSCLALEELVIINERLFRESSSVSNQNLKRLTFFCHKTDEKPNSVSFDTPNLLYLEFTDIVAAKYPKVKFDLLVEASLCIGKIPDVIDSSNDYSPDFFMGISNVKILFLSSETLEALTLCTVPVFKNVLHLTIETTQEVEWEAMPKLLENSPNLETLVFDGFHYSRTYQCSEVGYRFKDRKKCFVDDEDDCLCKPWYGTPTWLSSSPVKTLKILKFGEVNENFDDSHKQLDLIKYLLETMPNLEEVILYYDTPFDGDLQQLTTEFRKLEKVASTKCKIQVFYDNFTYSSTVYSSSSPSGLVFFKSPFPTWTRLL